MKQLMIIIISVIVIIFIINLIKKLTYFSPSKKILDINENFLQFYIRNLFCINLYNKYYHKIIVYCYNNTNNISYYQDKLLKLHNLGYNIIGFDYSGFGKSKGHVSEEQLYNDICLILANLLKTYENNKIILYGEQLGATIAIYGARRYNIPTIILESPIITIKYIFSKSLHKFLGLFCKEFDIRLYLKDYNGKSLLLYKNNDNIELIIPFFSQKNIIQDNLNIPLKTIKEFIEL